MKYENWEDGCPQCGSKNITQSTEGGLQRFCCDCEYWGCQTKFTEPKPKPHKVKAISPEELWAKLRKDSTLRIE
jgi:hypothetical protein